MFFRSTLVIRVLIAGITGCLPFGTTLLAVTYNCNTFSIPGANLHTNGVNNAGLIVGNTGSHGFLRDSGGNMTIVDYPGATFTQLLNINNHGISTGVALIPGSPVGTSINFTVDLNGNFTVIHLPPPYDGSLFLISGINDNGYISGWEATTFKWFILSPSGAISIAGAGGGYPYPGSVINPSAGLNNSLQLVEPSANFDFPYTKLFTPPGTEVPISPPNPVPGMGNGLASGINDAGAIVGFESNYHAGGRPYVPFIRDPWGAFSEIVCPATPHFAILPYSINDNGVIVGDVASAPSVAGAASGFIATPVAGLPQFTTTAMSVDFPTPSADGASTPRTVTISNTGNVRMDIGAMEFYAYPGYHASYFQVSGCVDNTTGYGSLAPGASCVLTITSTPAPASPRATLVTDRLIIDDSSPGSPHIIAVSMPSVPVSGQQPACVSTTYLGGSPRQVALTMQAGGNGIASLYLSNSVNATAVIPSFDPGTTSPVTVVMSEIDPGKHSRIDVQLTGLPPTYGGISCYAALAAQANQWSGIDSPSANGKMAVLKDSKGVLNLFAHSNENALLHTWQNRDGTWAPWENLGGVMAGELAAILKPDGGFEVFARGTDRALWYTAQLTAASSWSPWISMGGDIIGYPAAALDSDGNVEIFVRGNYGDSALWRNIQNGSWSGWTSLGGFLNNDPVVAANKDGRLEVFALGADYALWQTTQTTAGSNTWTQWSSLEAGAFEGTAAVVTNTDGLLEVFLRCIDGSVWRNIQSPSDDQAWNGWTAVGGYLTADPQVAMNKDGRIEIFGRGGGSYDLWHNVESAPGAAWSGWTSLGGILNGNIAVITDTDQRIEVFIRGGDSELRTIAQFFPGVWF